MSLILTVAGYYNEDTYTRRPMNMFRKKTIAIILLLLAGAAFFVSAEAELADLYVKTFHISKIYPHQLGYKVVYVKSNMELDTFYVPIEWFQEAGGKAEIAFGNGPAYPYCSVFYDYEEGAFDHIRIYAVKDMNDYSWGAFDNTSGMEDRFAVETLNIEY